MSGVIASIVFTMVLPVYTIVDPAASATAIVVAHPCKHIANNVSLIKMILKLYLFQRQLLVGVTRLLKNCAHDDCSRSQYRVSNTHHVL